MVRNIGVIVICLALIAYSSVLAFIGEEPTQPSDLVPAMLAVLGAIGWGTHKTLQNRKKKRNTNLPVLLPLAALPLLLVGGCTTGQAQQGQGDTRTYNALFNIETLHKLVVDHRPQGGTPDGTAASAPFSNLVGDVNAAAGDGGGEAAPGISFSNTVQPTSTAEDARADATTDTSAEADTDVSGLPGG